MKKINPGEKVSGKHLDWNNLKTFPRQGKFYFNFSGITSVYLSCDTNRLRFTACLFKITKDFKIGVTRTSNSLSHAIVWSNKAFFFFPYRLITRDLHSEKLGVRHQLARCFSSCRERGAMKTYWFPLGNRTSDFLRCSTIQPQRLYGEQGQLRSSYMTHVLLTTRISNVDTVMFCI